MKSLYDSIYCANSIDPVTDSTNTTPVKGVAVDTKGYNTAVLRFRSSVASQGTASLAVKLQESNTTTDGDFTDALDNTGTAIGATITPTTSAQAEVLARIEGLGTNRKKYLRIVVTPTLGGSAAVTIFGEILLGRAFKNATNTATSNT